MHFLSFLERADTPIVGPSATSRRGFLGLAGVAGAATLALSACDSNDDNNDADVTLDFSNDFGVLNYAYALEQLEAAFYVQVISTPYSGMTSAEMAILTDVRNHEVIHREFLKGALGSNAIGGLTPNFDAIRFNDRTSVLTTAKTFEDLGVAAYNGAGKYIKDTGYLTVAGKIVSVEARHAAVIRELLAPGSDSFANLTDIGNGSDPTKGLDGALKPDVVLRAAGAFIRQSVSARNF